MTSASQIIHKNLNYKIQSIIIHIHISFNLFNKWIRFQIQKYGFEFEINPFNWIWIRIGYIFGLSKLYFGMNFDLA